MPIFYGLNVFGAGTTSATTSTMGLGSYQQINCGTGTGSTYPGLQAQYEAMQRTANQAYQNQMYAGEIEWQRRQRLSERMLEREARHRQEMMMMQEVPPPPAPNPINAEARQRARELLLEHLTPEQRKTFEKNGWFIVEGGKSKTRYRIIAGGDGYAGNIEELHKTRDVPVARHCCHLNGPLPAADHHLAQKLMLEWDEDTFLRTTNRSRM